MEDGASPRRASMVSVPSRDADVDEILRFAQTIDGYRRCGSVVVAGAIGNSVLQTWQDEGNLPEDVMVLRLALFFEARRIHHEGIYPDGETVRYMLALVDRIRDVAADVPCD